MNSLAPKDLGLRVTEEAGRNHKHVYLSSHLGSFTKFHFQWPNSPPRPEIWSNPSVIKMPIHLVEIEAHPSFCHLQDTLYSYSILCLYFAVYLWICKMPPTRLQELWTDPACIWLLLLQDWGAQHQNESLEF